MPKKFDPKVRARAVRLVREHQDQYPSVTEAVNAVARQLGASRESVRRWLVQAEVDTGARPGVTSEENTELRKLRAENKRLREDVEILRAATVFFAGELDPRNR
jgi:transposase